MKTKMRKLLLPLLVLTACGSSNSVETTPKVSPSETAPAAEVALPTAESILDRALEVSGGAELYKAVKTYKINGTFAIPAQKIVGQLELWGGENRQFSMSIAIPGIGNERSGSDGTTAWSMSAMTGSRILTGPERERAFRDSDLLRDVNWKDYYKSATTKGSEDLEGKAAFVVEMIDNSGTSELRYYDKESGFLVRQTGTAKTQMGEMKTESRFLDYKELGGLIMPATVHVEVMGMKQVLSLSAAEINLEVPADAFALPADIKAIADAAAK